MPKISSALLVDDDPTTNFLNELTLRKMAVADKVTIARNGKEALEVLLEYCENPDLSCPRLVFLDIKMPVMDGFEFLEVYAKLPWAQQRAIVIVILTTSLHARDTERAKRLHVADFISKPLTPDKVSAILEKHFSQAH
ncbi:response regulator [Hymenobacter volaticus]|uniref:Response regulator n=1 Tax=Hymenobacter volaticus TaxID=2932254 RepID=A0ABY4G4P7_9BACT|nr:response regulator [Hymenobacter volaticus]UOQ65848.1 response regulator [Hymenobacter volaticus]